VANLRDLLREPVGAKESNRLNLLKVIMARPGNQTYLSYRSGLSPAAVSDAVRDLAKSGAVIATPDGQSVFVQMAPTTGVAVGIELGYQHTAIVARRVEQVYHRAVVRTCPAGAAGGTSSWLDEVIRNVDAAVAELGEQDLATIGMGIPRMVDPIEGELIPPLLPPWENDRRGPRKELEERLHAKYPGLSVKLDNDANLAALAESTYAFPEADTLVSIKVSTGVGAGIIIGGQVYRGRRGVAGEIGHMMIEPGGRFCSCGGRGCLETLIGGDALVEQARTVLGHKPQNWPSSLDDVMARAKEGNASCQRVLREAAGRLGQALGNVCNILNPQVVVISGAFGRLEAEDLVLLPCRAAIQQSAMRAAYEKDLQVVRSNLPHAAAHGALVLGLRGTTY
jgi:predicted NBD/HSP70 family sugar kinase